MTECICCGGLAEKPDTAVITRDYYDPHGNVVRTEQCGPICTECVEHLNAMNNYLMSNYDGE